MAPQTLRPEEALGRGYGEIMARYRFNATLDGRWGAFPIQAWRKSSDFGAIGQPMAW